MFASESCRKIKFDMDIQLLYHAYHVGTSYADHLVLHRHFFFMQLTYFKRSCLLGVAYNRAADVLGPLYTKF